MRGYYPGDAVTLATPNRISEFRELYWEYVAGNERVDLAANEAVFHQSVLLAEAVEHLAVRIDGLYVDATVGDGGHSLGILGASAPNGRVLGIDRDPRSLDRALQRIGQFADRFIPVHGNYTEMASLAEGHGIVQADGVLMDLGLSSRHLEGPGYGFSFMRDEPLDMRFDPEESLTAAHIVNTYREDDLGRLIFEYGEELRARAIARAIVRNRPIHTTGVLANLVARTLASSRRRRVHPATRTFQALRIAVNDELACLQEGLRAAVAMLAPAGRLVVISYHSLEDRLVKTFLARGSVQCICPPGTPVCICGHQPTVRIINRRVIKPSAEETRSNPRSRSARMRGAQRR